MSKSIVIDTVLQQYGYSYISNYNDLTFILRSKDIGYFTIYFRNKDYYYIIWCDGTPTLQPISPYVYNYFNIINYKFASESGIYLIIKYDIITNNILDLTETLSELKDELSENDVVV